MSAAQELWVGASVILHIHGHRAKSVRAIGADAITILIEIVTSNMRQEDSSCGISLNDGQFYLEREIAETGRTIQTTWDPSLRSNDMQGSPRKSTLVARRIIALPGNGSLRAQRII